MLNHTSSVILLCGLGCLGTAHLGAPLAAQAAPSLPSSGIVRPAADGATAQLDLPTADILSPLSVFTLSEVSLPSGRVVDLELERVHLATQDAEVFVDGHLAPGLSLVHELSLWSGHVVGEAESDVFLGISDAGTRGWIRTASELVHLLDETGTPGGTTRVKLLSDTSLRALGAAPDFSCGLDQVRDMSPSLDASALARLESAAIAAATGAFAGTVAPTPLPLLEARIAFETDTAYLEVFGGDIRAAQTYLVTLVGAVNHLYRREVGLILTVPFIGFHTGDDGWDTPDNGGTKLDMLLEFKGAWDGGQAPVDADLFHFMSGAAMNGGLAYLGAVCNGDFGFGVSANLDGVTPFPITPHPLNYDYYILAHELGHNFGAPHTHDFCQPLDQCAPPQYFGPCQSQQICQVGTIMSYCNVCPGGYLNIQDSFHPVTKQFMRGFLESYSCLRPFDGVIQRDAGSALAGASGTPRLTVQDDMPAGVVVQVRQAARLATGALIASPHEQPTPFFGGTLVPKPSRMLMIRTDAAGELNLVADTPPGLALPSGAPGWLQVWLRDAGGPEGFAATNAVEVEVILATLPEPVWIEHPTNGLEYALSTTGSLAALSAEAETHGGDLASIDSQALNDWLLMNFQNSGAAAVFIGLNDVRREGAFEWFDGQALTYTNWGTNQPNNRDPSGQQAVELMLLPGGPEGDQLEAGEWNDWTERGWWTNRAIMQRPVGMEAAR